MIAWRLHLLGPGGVSVTEESVSEEDSTVNINEHFRLLVTGCRAVVATTDVGCLSGDNVGGGSGVA